MVTARKQPKRNQHKAAPPSSQKAVKKKTNQKDVEEIKAHTISKKAHKKKGALKQKAQVREKYK